MALNETIRNLKNLLCNVSQDIERTENGNKAAAQRVRTGTIRLEKIAKHFRKESIQADKTGVLKKMKALKKTATKKAPAKKAAAGAKKKAPTKRPAARKAAPRKAAPRKAAQKRSSLTTKKATSAKRPSSVLRSLRRSRPLSMKRATAKLPSHHAR